MTAEAALPLYEAEARERQRCGRGGVLLDQKIDQATRWPQAAERAAKDFGTNRFTVTTPQLGHLRNLCCPQYGSCLDLAVREGRGFACDSCQHIRDRTPDAERLFSLALDQEGCQLLLVAIFDPERYHAYRELRSVREAGPVVAEASKDEKGEGDHTNPEPIV